VRILDSGLQTLTLPVNHFSMIEVQNRDVNIFNYGFLITEDSGVREGSASTFNIFSVVFNPWPVKTETMISSGLEVSRYLFRPAVVAAEVGSI